MWDVLKEYPAARVRLEAIAVKRLEKYKKAPLEKGRWLSDRYFKLLFVIIFFCDGKKKLFASSFCSVVANAEKFYTVPNFLYVKLNYS